MSSSYEIFSTIQRQRVSDGQIVPILSDCADYKRLLILVWPQLGDFDSLEYAWWLEKEAALWQNAGITIRAIGIGDRNSGLKFAEYTKFRQDWLFVDPKAELHNLLGLYRGLSLKLPGFSPGQNAWLNLIFMCGGVGSPGTLAEVLRGYRGDRKAPQLIAPLEELSKVEIVQIAIALNVPISATWSCYQGEAEPCGLCDSCRIRDQALIAAGYPELATPIAREKLS